MGEYLPAYAERLAWLTAFTGSAGAAVVLKDKAAIFVDGRYTLAGAQPDRHHRCSSRAIWWRKDRRAGFRIICRRAPSSVTTPGCTPSMA